MTQAPDLRFFWTGVFIMTPCFHPAKKTGVRETMSAPLNKYGEEEALKAPHHHPPLLSPSRWVMVSPPVAGKVWHGCCMPLIDSLIDSSPDPC